MDKFEEWDAVTTHLSQHKTVTLQLADKDRYHTSTAQEEAVAEAAEELGFTAPQHVSKLEQLNQELTSCNSAYEARIADLEIQVQELNVKVAEVELEGLEAQAELEARLGHRQEKIEEFECENQRLQKQGHS